MPENVHVRWECGSPRGGWGTVTWQPSPRGWWGTVFPGVGQDRGGGVQWASSGPAFSVPKVPSHRPVQRRPIDLLLLDLRGMRHGGHSRHSSMATQGPRTVAGFGKATRGWAAHGTPGGACPVHRFRWMYGHATPAIPFGCDRLKCWSRRPPPPVGVLRWILGAVLRGSLKRSARAVRVQCARSATIWASSRTGDPCFEIIGASSLPCCVGFDAFSTLGI